jgi:cell division protein FtsZ
MSGMGYAMMGTASARGENAAVAAAEKAISSPLMEAGGVRGARGVLINITGSSSLGLHEVNQACTLIAEATGNDDVQINFGVVMDEEMGEEVKITVIATGFVRENLPRIERRGAHVESDPAPAPVAAAPPEPVYEEPEPAEPLYEEAPMTMAAGVTNGATSGAANGSTEPMFDDLEVPAILRRERRMVQ